MSSLLFGKQRKVAMIYDLFLKNINKSQAAGASSNLPDVVVAFLT